MTYSVIEIRQATRILQVAARSENQKVATAAQRALSDQKVFEEFLEMRRRKLLRSKVAAPPQRKSWWKRWWPKWAEPIAA